MEAILDEVVELFPGEVIHVGGDECRKGNWRKCAKCQDRIRLLGIKDEHALQGWAAKRIAGYLAGKGRRMMGWDELAAYDDLPRTTISQSWRGASYCVAATNPISITVRPEEFGLLTCRVAVRNDTALVAELSAPVSYDK